MSETPQIQARAPKPPGLVPKNVQTWLLVGIAFLMVAIMWLTGGKKPAAPGRTAPAPVPAPLEVNEAKVAELQNRIVELQRQQRVAENALEQQARVLAAAPTDTGQASSRSDLTRPTDPRVEDPIAAEAKRRGYISLFASNVALSYRPAPAGGPGAAPVAAADALPEKSPEPPAGHSAILQLEKDLQALQASPSSPSARSADSNRRQGEREEANPASIEDRSTGRSYLLLEGTILETVLINRLDGQFSGPVECLVSTGVYSHDRQHLLIPAGSKLLGETKRVDTFGQTRLAVLFHRLIMPDGYSVNLDRFTGLDQIGDTGLRDEVNNHYLRIFGVSLAIGALGSVAEQGTVGGLNASGADLMRQGFAASTAESSAQILDKFLNILPTVTIREGHRVKVYLSGDLTLPDYANHTMPSNL